MIRALLAVVLFGMGVLVGVTLTDAVETPDPAREGLVAVILLQKQTLDLNTHTIHVYQHLYDSMNTSLEACLIPMKESSYGPPSIHYSGPYGYATQNNGSPATAR